YETAIQGATKGATKCNTRCYISSESQSKDQIEGEDSSVPLKTAKNLVLGCKQLSRNTLKDLICRVGSIGLVHMGRRHSATPSRLHARTNKPDVFARELKDDGVFPNNKLPLLIYRRAVLLVENDSAATFEELFAANHWGGSWRNGIYPYHH